MKTMLGGWNETGFWSAEQVGARAAPAQVSVSRCVPVNTNRSAHPGEGRAYVRLPALQRTLLVPAAFEPVVPHRACAARAEPFRNLARRQPPPLPARWHDRPAPAAEAGSASARLARIALDATCELREEDLLVFSALTAAPPALARQPSVGLRKGLLAGEVPPPRRRALQRGRFMGWLCRCFGRSGPTR